MPDQEGCYLAEPSGPGRGGVLVVHDWYGLLPHVRTLCDELAAAGLVATAPTSTTAARPAWPGTEHSFANADVALYAPTQAAEAWSITVRFLRHHLGSP
jgi:dienelactone hydrolase